MKKKETTVETLASKTKPVVSSSLEEQEDDEEDVVQEGWKDHMSMSFWLSLRLFAYSPIGLSAALVFWWPRTFIPSLEYLRPNMTNMEPMIYPKPSSFSQLILKHANYDLAFSFFFPVAFACFLRGARATQIKLLFSGFVIMILTRLGIQNIGVFAGLIPSFTLPLVLITFLPKESRIPRLSMYVCVTTILGIAFLMLFSNIPLQTDTSKILMIVVFFPAFREGAYYFSRVLCKELGFSTRVETDELKVDRSQTWFLFLWLQIMAAMNLRLLFTSFSNRTYALVGILAQSVQELVLRISLPYRDDMARRITSRTGAVAPTKSVRAAIIPTFMPNVKGARVITIDSSRSTNDKVKARILQYKAFYSMVLCGEMLAEYIAILLSACVIWVYRSYPLQISFPFFLTLNDPFKPVTADYYVLLENLALQVLAEVLVDTICSIFEVKCGFRLLAAWNGRPKNFWFITFCCTYYASVLVFSYVDTKDFFSSCKPGMDLCCCGKLQPQGVRYNYCERIYSNQTALWPNATCITP